MSTPEMRSFAVRVDAMTFARDLLVVKAGQFAERPLDPEALIVVAEWLLGIPPTEVLPWGPETPEEEEAFRKLRSAFAKNLREQWAGLS